MINPFLLVKPKLTICVDFNDEKYHDYSHPDVGKKNKAT